MRDLRATGHIYGPRFNDAIVADALLTTVEALAGLEHGGWDVMTNVAACPDCAEIAGHLPECTESRSRPGGGSHRRESTMPDHHPDCDLNGPEWKVAACTCERIEKAMADDEHAWQEQQMAEHAQQADEAYAEYQHEYERGMR